MDNDEWMGTTLGFLRKMSKICSSCVRGNGSWCQRCYLDGVVHASEWLLGNCPSEKHTTMSITDEILDYLKEHGRCRLDGIKTSSFTPLKEKLQILDDLVERGIIKREKDTKRHAYYTLNNKHK